MSAITHEARQVLDRGTLCYLAASSDAGPHVTPVVFVLEGDRLWVTTARATVKARAWRRDPRVAGLVRTGDRALAFRGSVERYDLLEPASWARSLTRAPRLALAASRFSLKNARFFAGYARDAYRVPLGWTPPGRVLASITLDAGAVLDVPRGSVLDRWGTWNEGLSPASSFRATSVSGGPGARIPPDVRSLLDDPGDGVVGLASASGLSVLPARCAPDSGAFVAVLFEEVARLSGFGPKGPAALVVDRPSAWRASRMKGILLRGEGGVYTPDALRSGAASLLRRAGAAGPLPESPAILRLRPSSTVWWRGWAAGTVRR